ncbi:MAG: serine hydrolase domain-containing protein [Thermomicrobiales bacterium]
MQTPRSGQLPAFSRRHALRAAGIAATAMATIGFEPGATRAQEATPAAAALPDLTGVTPLPLTGEHLATFESYVAGKVAELGVPGVAVGVVQDGEVAFLQGFGVRELGRPEPVTPDTLLRIGSVTKSFSSLLAATLVDTGQVAWDTPLVDLLPDFAVEDAELTPRLTVEDAFCACSGLPRRDLEFIFPANDLTPERMIASMATLPLTAPFGEKYQYNNQLVAAGGFAAGVADGGSAEALGHAYAIALRDRVLNPIGMPRTTYNLSEVVAGNDYASPHAADLFGEVRPVPLLMDDTWLTPVAPSGALWSSVREMVRYVQMELQHGVAPDGVEVVSPENLERTWQPGVALPHAPGSPPEMADFAQHYGLGWVVGAYGGQRAIWHSGGTLGFSSLVTFLPEAGLGAVVLTNGSGAAGQLIYAVTFRLLELLFEQPATMDALVAANLAGVASGRADLLATIGQIDPAVVTPFLGTYANPDLGDLTLTLRGDTLTFASGPYRSALLPQMAEDGSVAGYLIVDPPLSGFPPQGVFVLEPGTGGQPRIVLTVPADGGEPDLVYVYEPLGTTATPTA